MVTINVNATELARAYFNGTLTGCVRAPAGLTSEGRPVAFIIISRGARRITLSGVIAKHKWQETYATIAPIDD